MINIIIGTIITFIITKKGPDYNELIERIMNLNVAEISHTGV